MPTKSKTRSTVAKKKSKTSPEDLIAAKRTCVTALVEEDTAAAIAEWKPNQYDIEADAFLEKNTFGRMSFKIEDVERILKSKEWKHSSLAIWTSTVPSDSSEMREANSHTNVEVESIFLRECNSKVKYIGAVRTLPCLLPNGSIDAENGGGRCDVILLVDEDSVGKFAVRRIKFGLDKPRWGCDIDDTVYPHSVRRVFSNLFVNGITDSSVSSLADKFIGKECGKMHVLGKDVQ